MSELRRSDRVTLSRLTLLVCWVAGWSLLVAQSCPPPPVEYVYDDNGRLLAVIDPRPDLSGNTGNNVAVYAYDEVGNITSINAYSNSQVSIISVSPRCGTSSTTITIRGTGFASPATNNAVTFNGQVANVTGGTATTLTVTPPSGSAAGTVVVKNTSTGGTSQMPNAFAGVCGSPPTITGFSPTTGPIGTLVQIDGTNFQTSTADDHVMFGNVSAMVWSATTTRLQATASATGQVFVATPYGSISTVNKFLAIPSPYAAADVGSTLTMTIGTTQAVSLPTANRVALLLFDVTSANAGKRLAIAQSDVSHDVNLCVYSPSGRLLGCNTATPWVTAAGLSDVGTYALVAAPVGSFTGGIDVRVALVPNGSQQTGARLYLHDFDMSPYITPPTSTAYRRMDAKLGAGTSSTWACRSGVTSPSAFQTVPDHLNINWVTPPLALPVRIDCNSSVSFAAWGMESSGQANAAFGAAAVLPTVGAPTYLSGTDNVEMTIGNSGCDSGAGSGATLHTWTATLGAPCPVQMLPGDRITFAVNANAAPGTNGPNLNSGRSVEMHYNRNTDGADGASYLDLSQAIPSGSLTFDCTNAAECGP